MSLFASIGFTAAAAAIATTTLEVGAVVLSVGMSAYSSISQSSAQAQAQKNNDSYQAAVARNNAAISLQNRSASMQQGDKDAQLSQMHQAQVLGAQRASLAANGIDLTQGSAQDLLSTTRFMGAQDVATIQSNAARTAWGYQVQGSNESAKANLLQHQSDTTNPTKIGAMAGATSLMSSAGSYAMMKLSK